MAKKSKAQKQVEKTVKRSHKATVVLAVLFLLIGIAAGVGASWFLTKDDTFELNGRKGDPSDGGRYVRGTGRESDFLRGKIFLPRFRSRRQNPILPSQESIRSSIKSMISVIKIINL